jgi:hypothetical protein
VSRIAALGRKGIIAAFQFSPEEYLARAAKDLLADTNEYATIQRIAKYFTSSSIYLAIDSRAEVNPL